MDLDGLWKAALAEIELQISRPNFLTWFRNSKLLAKDGDGGVVVGLNNNFAKEWVQNKYHKSIFVALRGLDESVKRIEYVVIPEKKKFVSATPETKKASSLQGFPQLNVDPETNLHPKYSFGSFVVGSSNELAYAASSAIVESVGRKYNPFFLYGGTGLGKTHLLQAMGNEIKEKYKNKIRVKYVPSEKFVNDVVWSIRNKRIEDMKTKYRTTDVLIIDDIQFIGGKERSEEEFFHTFNTLHQNDKQIIISSDRPPAAIPTLEARLRSRFEGGMIADITYPDYEMRMAIIKTKLGEKRFFLPDVLCDLIANRVKRNIRELEGVLNKIMFYQEIKNIEPSPSVVEEIIDSTIEQYAKNVTPSQVIGAVSGFFEMTTQELINRSRKKEVVEPRQIAAFLLRDILNMSYPDIGEKLGKRDHTTAIYAFEKISHKINNNKQLNQKIILIKELIYKN